MASTNTEKGNTLLEFIKTIFYAVVIAGLIRTLLFQPFWIPSGSMKPNLLIGDFLFVNKFAYGYSRYSCPYALCPIYGRIFFKTQIIENGGWHFTFLKKPEDIVKKMKSYGHGDLKELGDITNIKKNIEKNKFFLNDKINVAKVEINKNLPQFIVDNQDYYKEWIQY